MKQEIIFEMTSPYRDTFRIKGFKFGNGEDTVAVVGTMRGDEIQQQYIGAKLVSELRQIERNGGIEDGKSILVIPTCNPFSLNVNRRFWAMDNTDINRMFPGYDKGETTQRIAAAIFNRIKDFKYGMQLASFYVAGDFIPHVRLLKTGYEAVEDAKLFGMPYVTLRKPLPFDTALLNYNWQIWESKAFSIYTGHTDVIDEDTSRLTLNSILRFINKVGVVCRDIPAAAYESIVYDEKDLVTIQANHAGILERIHGAGAQVNAGEVLARITDPLTGEILSEIKSPVSGCVFFSHHRPLVYQNALLYRIIPF